MRAPAVLLAGGALVFAPVLGLVVVVAATPPANAASGRGAGLKAGAVPAAYADAVGKAGATCPAVSGPLIGAQIEAESGWNLAAVSPVGAEGLSQFMPGTWATHGVDANGDGSADPFDPFDAIVGQALYDCSLAAAVAAVPGDATANMLAAYNAGPAAVLQFGGVPPYAETQQYVKTIESLIATYSAGPAAAPAGVAGAALTAAQTMIGVPYSWGGENPSGFDCSGLTLWAYAQAGVQLLRTADAQENAAAPTSDPQPGDLVFFDTPGTTYAYHVGLYLGGGQMLDAPHTGAQVRVEPVWSDVSGYGRVA